MNVDMPTVVRIGALAVPGATLHHEVRGRGPVLLAIPGGPMDSGAFTGLAARLCDRYTVVTYDPRGMSRSPLDGPPEDQRIATQADDAHRLLAAVGSAPASVLATSSGALTALELVARHPEQVRTLVAHEPPLTELLPDAADHRASGRRIHATYRRHGVGAAMAEFLADSDQDDAGDVEPDDSGPPDPEAQATMARIGANLDFFFAHVWRSLEGYAPDLDVLRSVPTRIVVAIGEASTEQVAGRAAAALATRLGTEPAVFPGDHGGPWMEPVPFADRLDAVLRAG